MNAPVPTTKPKSGTTRDTMSSTLVKVFSTMRPATWEKESEGGKDIYSVILFFHK
jgi:hypothetical protein